MWLWSMSTGHEAADANSALAPPPPQEGHVPRLLYSLWLAAAFYAAAFALVLLWTAWSVRKHGCWKRSLRRFSYLLFLLLLATRLAWFGVLWAYLADHPLAPALHALRSTPAIALDHLAFLVHFLAFSMLVCGWADSTYMMMSGRSLQPTAVRSPTIFYHIGGAFVAVNLLNALVAVGTLAPLLLERGGGGGGDSGDADAGGGTAEAAPGGSGYFVGDSSGSLASFALWMGSLSAGCFSLLLAASSTVAGKPHTRTRRPSIMRNPARRTTQPLLTATPPSLGRRARLLQDPQHCRRRARPPLLCPSEDDQGGARGVRLLGVLAHARVRHVPRGALRRRAAALASHLPHARRRGSRAASDSRSACRPEAAADCPPGGVRAVRSMERGLLPLPRFPMLPRGRWQRPPRQRRRPDAAGARRSRAV